MKKPYRADVHGKPIVHGRRYVYISRDLLCKDIHGVITWDRVLLAHIFTPDDKELDPVIVNYEINSNEHSWLCAPGYIRERK